MTASLRLADIQPLYAFLDPAGPKKRHEGLKHVASRSAIVVGGQDDLGRVFVLHAWAMRCGTDALMNRILDINRRWMPKLFGCETNNLASLFSDAVRRDASMRDQRVPLVGFDQPATMEKDYRIRTILQPLIGNGRLFLNESDPGILELRSEIRGFPMSFQKDLVDATASLCRMMPLRNRRGSVDTEEQAYLQYLRESGADPRVIEQSRAKLRAARVATIGAGD